MVPTGGLEDALWKVDAFIPLQFYTLLRVYVKGVCVCVLIVVVCVNSVRVC